MGYRRRRRRRCRRNLPVEGVGERLFACAISHGSERAGMMHRKHTIMNN